MQLNKNLRHLLLPAALAFIPLTLQAQSRVAFTAAQATEGQPGYAQNCAGCHGRNMDDGEFAPPVKGSAFRQHWSGKSVGELFTYVSTRMPPGNAGGLGDSVYRQVTAFILQSNSIPLDAKNLPSVAKGDANAPDSDSPGGGLSPFARLIPAPPKPNPLDKITPVTDADLQNPPASEWLTWRRTYDDQGFSPLKQINKSNVAQLRSTWSWSLFPGANEATPLVHDGVMFVHSSGDHVQALDAVTGDLLWQYSRELPKPKQGFLNLVKRNIAIYENHIFLDTSDLHVVALDMKTGDVAWDHEILDR